MISFLKHRAETGVNIFVAILVIALFPFHLNAQQNALVFSPLGSTHYQTRITELEKYAVPNKYAEKSAQAWYQEMMTDRNSSLIHLFKDDAVI